MRRREGQLDNVKRVQLIQALVAHIFFENQSILPYNCQCHSDDVNYQCIWEFNGVVGCLVVVSQSVGVLCSSLVVWWGAR